jgi:hypothetical protein
MEQKIDLGPEYVLKTLHKVLLDKLLSNPKGKPVAHIYAYTLTKYGADTLLFVRKSLIGEKFKKSEEILGVSSDNISDLAYSPEIINELSKDENLKKLLGVKLSVSFIKPKVTEKDVQSHLDNIFSSFPTITTFEKWESYKAHDTSTWEYPILKTSEGNIRLLRSTTVTNKKTNDFGVDNQATAAGKLVDLIIRKFFRNPIDYDKFIENMKKDKDVLRLFKTVSENTFILDNSIFTPLQEGYLAELLDDIIHVIHYIQYSYPDSHITDLTDKDGKTIKVYSKLGVIGEIDLLAIQADGTYTVIDLKLSGKYTKAKGEKFNKQLSFYDDALSTVKGMKSSGKVDVINMKMDISNVGRLIGSESIFRLTIPTSEKISYSPLPKAELKTAAEDHLKALDAIYIRQKSIGAAPFSFFGKPLKQKYLEREGLNTIEDLVNAQEWLLEHFPELKGKIDIIRIFNSDAGGEFFLDLIRLYERSNKGVHYHEGWHRFSQLYLTRKEKIDLYQSIQNDNITFTTRDGRKLKTPTAQLIDIEEFLAEEFRKYAQSPSTYSWPTSNSKPKSIFKRMWEFLKRLFGFYKKGGPSAYISLFRELDNNTFNRSNFSVNNAIFHNLQSLFNDPITGNSGLLDNAAFIKMRNLADSVTTEYLTTHSLTPIDVSTDFGLKQIKNVISNSFNNINDTLIKNKEKLIENLDVVDEDNIIGKKSLENLIATYTYFIDILSYTTETNEEGNDIRMGSFLNSYFKFSRYKSFRGISQSYSKELKEIVDEDALAQIISTEEDIDETDIETDEGNMEDLDFNNPGNKYHPSSLMKDLVKDFFNGIYRMKSDDINETEFERDEIGLPVMVDSDEAFNKTLEILQGAFTLELMRDRLYNVENQAKFPEIRQIRDRLFGTENNPERGLIPRLYRIGEEIEQGQVTLEKFKEHMRLTSFLLHFQHIMSMRKVKSDNLVLRIDLDPNPENPHITSVITTRDNVEAVIHSIIGDFMKEFQTNMEIEANMGVGEFDLESYEFKKTRKVRSIYDVFYSLIMDPDGVDLNDPIPLYDHIRRQFYFNPFYLRLAYAGRYSPEPQDLRKFFQLLGININKQAFKNPNHYAEMIDVYRKIVYLLDKNARLFSEKMDSLRNEKTANTKKLLKAWKAKLEKIEKSSLTEKVILAEQILEDEGEIIKYINDVFTTNPVLRLMQDSRDKGITSKKEYRPLTAWWSLFQRLAKIEKNYHKRFSSGSVIVGKDRKWMHFLTNNLLATETFVNEHINSIEDFAKYPHLSHLDPIKNPRMKNSVVLNMIFDETGKKRDGYVLSISTLDIVTLVTRDFKGYQFAEQHKLSDMNADLKLFTDIVMIGQEGWGEGRRMEASDTSWRPGVVKMEGEERVFVKPFYNISSFDNTRFLSLIRGYIQYAASNFKYYNNPVNEERSKYYKRRKELGVFDEMLPDSSDSIKEYIKDGVDPNDLMVTIEKDDPTLFQKINKEIIKYFEDIAFNNDNSFKNSIDGMLSNRSKVMLKNLSQIDSNTNAFYMTVDEYNNLKDSKITDIIAHDFIQVMEDAIWFFGDYTYYEDPVKRRKVEANNGSINILGNTLADAVNVQMKHYSLSSVYHNSKGTTLDKDPQIVRKTVVNDITMESDMLKDDQIWKDLQEVFSTKFDKQYTVDEIKADARYIYVAEALKKMKSADAAAFGHPDHIIHMRMREMLVDEKLMDEYFRQQLILKEQLGGKLSKEEEREISKPKSSINVSKFATTGPILHAEPAPFEQAFDKMGMRALLPEYDYYTVMRPVMLDMLRQGINYVVTDTGSKIFIQEKTPIFTKDGEVSIPKTGLPYVEHSGLYHKFQQNTTVKKEETKLSIQLRAMISELNLIMQTIPKFKTGNIPQSFVKHYKDFIKTIGDFIVINSNHTLSRMGMNTNGIIIDKSAFVKYMRDRLLDQGIENEDLLVNLDVDENGSFLNFLETLPFQKDIGDLLAGIINDNFRSIDISGSKLVQSSELGTKLRRNKDGVAFGANKLRTIRLKRNNKGDIIGIEPWEAKIPFRKEFYGLLSLLHPDGQTIRNTSSPKDYLRRLNEALQNEEWVEKHKDVITLMGVRVPFQQENFGGVIRIAEFLPESLGDMIILPPEFYTFTGSDNDIDSVTSSFPQVSSTGQFIKRPEETYNEILDRIDQLQNMLSDVDKENLDITSGQEDNRLIEIINKFKEQEIYSSRGWTLDDLAADFQLVKVGNMIDIAGRLNPKSKLMKLVKKNMHPELLQELYNHFEGRNKGRKLISGIVIELNSLRIKKNNYIKGILNDILSSSVFFWSQPEMFPSLISTDSISPIKEIAEKMAKIIQGRVVDLDRKNTSLQSMTPIKNINDHNNHFIIRRAFLGKSVKMRSMMTILSTLGYTIPTEIRLGSYSELLKRGNVITDPLMGLNKSKDKTYIVKVRTPLLYKEDTRNGVELSIFDENGNSITKNLSILASAAIDLFNNPYILPSLNIAAMSVDSLLFLLAQGVPLERAVLFLNNPVVQEIQDRLEDLGHGAQSKHGIVDVAHDIQDIIDSNHSIFLRSDTQSGRAEPQHFRVKDMHESGREAINNFMPRPAKFAESYLENKDLSFKEEDLEKFLNDFSIYKKDKPSAKLKNFLEDNQQYVPYAKDILAYYTILVETSQTFYSLMAARLDRASAKMKDISGITNMKSGEQLRLITNLTKPEFEAKLRTESVISPFYRDETLLNIITSKVSELFKDNKYLKDKFIETTRNIILNVRGTEADKSKVEERILSDFIHSIFSNFYIAKIGESANIPYELFRFDITPLTRFLAKNKTEALKEIGDTFSGKRYKDLPDEARIQAMFSDGLFSEQMSKFFGKYYELKNSLTLFSSMNTDKAPSVDPQKTENPNEIDLLNEYPQLYISLNLSSDPHGRSVEEQIMRDEFNKLMDFSLDLFPTVAAIIDQNNRTEFYNRPEVKEEIRMFANVLALRLLTQSPHLQRGKAAYSYIIPYRILKETVETSIENFHHYLETGTSISGDKISEKESRDLITRYMVDFTKIYRLMNDDHTWLDRKPPDEEKLVPTSEELSEDSDDFELEEIPYDEDPMGEGFDDIYRGRPRAVQKKEGIPYQKSYTGKVYGSVVNNSILLFRMMLAKEKGWNLQGRNEFKITDEDPLNCI